MIYENFREVKLRDICSRVCDGDWIETKDQGGKDYRLLQISNLGTGKFVETDKYRWISNEKFEALQCNEILNGDVLIARMPEPIGRCWWVDKLPWRAITSVDVTIARPLPEKVDGRYLAYYINSPRTLARLNNLSTGTTRMRVRRADLADFTIHLPPLEEQREISNILGSIDEKIELNTKTNETLEDMAKAIFKSWFIDFDPVRAKAEGRSTGLPDEISALFPSSFEDAEFGQIPKDWKRVSISQFVDIKSSKRVKMSEYKNEGVPFYRSKEIIQKASKQSINTEIFISNSQYESFRQKHGVPAIGDLLLTSVGTLGIPYLVREIDGKFYFKDGNLTWFTNFSKKFDSKYLFYFLQSKEGKRRINEISIGSTQAALTIEGLKSITITLPPTSIMQIFSEITNSFLQKISINLEQTSVFEKIKGSILPKLISGELRIPDAEEMIKELEI